jgi:hypothetical protein
MVVGSGIVVVVTAAWMLVAPPFVLAGTRASGLLRTVYASAPIVTDVTVKVIPVPLEVLPPIVPERVAVIFPVPGVGAVCVILMTNVVPAMML